MAKAKMTLTLIGTMALIGHAVGFSIKPDPITIVEYQPSKGGSYRRVHSYPRELPLGSKTAAENSSHGPENHATSIEDLINPRLGAGSHEAASRVVPEETNAFRRPTSPSSLSSSGTLVGSSEDDGAFGQYARDSPTVKNDIPRQTKPVPRPSSVDDSNDFILTLPVQPEHNCNYFPLTVGEPVRLAKAPEHHGNFNGKPQQQAITPRPLTWQDDFSSEIQDANDGHGVSKQNFDYEETQRREWLRPLPRPTERGRRYRRRTEKAIDDMPSAIPAFNPFK